MKLLKFRFDQQLDSHFWQNQGVGKDMQETNSAASFSKKKKKRLWVIPGNTVWWKQI